MIFHHFSSVLCRNRLSTILQSKKLVAKEKSVKITNNVYQPAQVSGSKKPSLFQILDIGTINPDISTKYPIDRDLRLEEVDNNPIIQPTSTQNATDLSMHRWDTPDRPGTPRSTISVASAGRLHEISNNVVERTIVGDDGSLRSKKQSAYYRWNRLKKDNEQRASINVLKNRALQDRIRLLHRRSRRSNAVKHPPAWVKKAKPRGNQSDIKLPPIVQRTQF